MHTVTRIFLFMIALTALVRTFVLSWNGVHQGHSAEYFAMFFLIVVCFAGIETIGLLQKIQTEHIAVMKFLQNNMQNDKKAGNGNFFKTNEDVYAYTDNGRAAKTS